MTLNIVLPPETETKLRERALATGKDPAALVVEAVQEKLATQDAASTDNGQSRTNWDEALDAFVVRARAWADENVPAGHVVDDRRQTIYPDCGP